MKIDTGEVESIATALTREFSLLPASVRNEMIVNIGKAEIRMRQAGQERPVWRGPVSEMNMMGADVVVPTAQGDRRGRVVCFGLVNSGIEWERSVIVHVPASGTQHEAPASQARLASPEDSERIRNEISMAARLVAVAGPVGPTPIPVEATAVKERPKKRGQKDPKLIQRMLELAAAHPKVWRVEEGSTNYKILGVDRERRIYLFKSQLRADLSGFQVAHPGVRQIDEREARDMHLGRVRGQVTFDDRETALAGFSAALDGLG